MAHPVDIALHAAILVGTSCCVLAMYSAMELGKLRSEGVRTTAQVVGFNQTHPSQRRLRTGTVRHGARRDRLRFEVNGKTVLLSAEVSGTAELLGEVEVLYMADDPQTACVAPCDTSTGIYLAGGVGLFLLGAGLWGRHLVGQEEE